MCKKIKIQAYGLKSETISGLKDSLKLYIPKFFGCKIQKDDNLQNYHIFSCTQEYKGGIYEFNINPQIPLYSQVFVRLIGDTTYCKDPYFLHSTCTQINLLECMVECDKPIPFVFTLSPKEINIGILKAYKANNTARENQTKTYFMNHTNANANLDSNIKSSFNENTNTFLEDLTSLSNPHNEIYTIDLEQEIQLKAFVYEEQRTYVAKVKDEKTQIEYENELQQGNITKTIKELSQEESSQIQWAFKIVNESYHGKKATTGRLKEGQSEGGEPFPPLGEKQILKTENKKTDSTQECISLKSNNNADTTSKDSSNEANNYSKLNSIPKDNVYIELENYQGDCIHLSLKDLFTREALESLVGKNIIFFAYDKDKGINKTKGDGIHTETINGTKRIIDIDNAYTQYAMKNYQEWKKRQITKDRITSIELKILKTRFSLEFDGETLTLLENQRELKQWKTKNNNTNIEEKNCEITITYDSNQRYLQNIDINIKNELCSLFQTYKIPQNATIPLKVQYPKRILILIERFKETTESTKARMNIFIDKKRVDKNGNLTNESLDSTLNITDPYAYILERNGPDCIGGELKLRIPSGRYGVEWSNGSFGEVLNLYNNFVAKGRAILIHGGNSPKSSDGCLLINQSQVFKDKEKTIEIDNLLRGQKKDILAQHIKDKFTKAILNRTTQNLQEFVEKYIEIRIINHFTKE